jgi:uncharacterized protein (TIGR02246 family)
MLQAAALCLSLFASALPRQTGSNDDRKAIRALIDRFTDAWNKHDAHAFASVFAEDADFTNVAGKGATGRSQIEAFHAPVFATIFKNSHVKYTDAKIRFIRADVAAVDVPWEMTGVLDPQGNPRPDRVGLLNFTMANDGGQWQIVVMHNLDLTPAPPSSK